MCFSIRKYIPNCIIQNSLKKKCKNRGNFGTVYFMVVQEEGSAEKTAYNRIQYVS